MKSCLLFRGEKVLYTTGNIDFFNNYIQLEQGIQPSNMNYFIDELRFKDKFIFIEELEEYKESEIKSFIPEIERLFWETYDDGFNKTKLKFRGFSGILYETSYDCNIYRQLKIKFLLEEGKITGLQFI